MSSVFYIYKHDANHFYFYILSSKIFSSFNSILSYLIIKEFSNGVNWKINENQFSDNADNYYRIWALCLKKVNKYVIISWEYDYAEKNKK